MYIVHRYMYICICSTIYNIVYLVYSDSPPRATPTKYLNFHRKLKFRKIVEGVKLGLMLNIRSHLDVPKYRKVEDLTVLVHHLYFSMFWLLTQEYIAPGSAEVHPESRSGCSFILYYSFMCMY